MNPYSPEAVQARAARHAADVAERDRLAAVARANPSRPNRDALARADQKIRSSMSRMLALGDPVSGTSTPESPPSPVSPFPAPAGTSREAEIERAVASIVAAHKAALGQ